ncbi:hypothetical protein Patl1_15031 [Pistacia atlantica]|uniref:Uncharacterized protein n=1 Tax=Pistacia atlantica TaxID=434234 RepID=A0ACC1B8F0_9ROSI|nr:hypothetical protein Patl1_15031 [Pistacia atlantica]
MFLHLGLIILNDVIGLINQIQRYETLNQVIIDGQKAKGNHRIFFFFFFQIYCPYIQIKQ